MHESFLLYYQQVLDELYQALNRYADQYPNQSQGLNLKDLAEKDPSVERLLAGFAYLAAQLQEKIKDDVPELSQSILGALAPDFLRPIPSQLIIRYATDCSWLAKTQLIQQEAECLLEDVKFRLSHPLRLCPIELKASFVNEESKRPRMDLEFGVLNDAALKNLDFSNISIYLEGKFASLYVIYRACLSSVDAIELLVLEENRPIKSQLSLLSEQLMRTQWLEEGGAMKGCQRFFLFPQQFMFLYVHGLENTVWPKGCRKFTVRLFFKTGVDLSDPVENCGFHLNCALAENAYCVSAEPIRLTQGKVEHPLVLDYQVRSKQVLDVIKVFGEHNYEKYQLMNSRSRYVYEIFKRKNCQSSLKYFLRFSGSDLVAKDEVISTEVLICDGNFAREQLTKSRIFTSISSGHGSEPLFLAF